MHHHYNNWVHCDIFIHADSIICSISFPIISAIFLLLPPQVLSSTLIVFLFICHNWCITIIHKSGIYCDIFICAYSTIWSILFPSSFSFLLLPHPSFPASVVLFSLLFPWDVLLFILLSFQINLLSLPPHGYSYLGISGASERNPET